MGYTGHVVYTVDGDTKSLYEWKSDNTEEAMRFAEAIQLVRGTDVKSEYLDLAEGNIYKSVGYRTYDNEKLETLHLMSGMLGDAMSNKEDCSIKYEKERESYRVRFLYGENRGFNYCSLDEKGFTEFAEAFSKVSGISVKDYKTLAHGDGIYIPAEELAKSLRPVVLEQVNKFGKEYPEILKSTSGLELVNTLREEMAKDHKVYLCARASANGKKNIVMRIDDNGKKSIKTLPFKMQDMTVYSLCVSGEWAGNYEKINKKEDADLLLQANRLVGKTKSLYSSIAKKVAKNLQEGKEASLDIGGGY